MKTIKDFGPFNRLFMNDDDFENNIRNLWAIRSGLDEIIENRPDLKDEILPKFESINQLIDVITNVRPYHPSCGFFGKEDALLKRFSAN